MFSVQLLYCPYLLNWVGPAVQSDGPTQSTGRNWPCKTWIGARMEASCQYTMGGFGDHGLFVNEGGQDNVYQNLLASIDRRNQSGSSITVGVVHALSKKVFLAKNKRRDKAPTTMLSKKQFAHVLVYICNRNQNSKINGLCFLKFLN